MIKNTLYAQYAKEREGCEILETKYGFVSYRVQGEIVSIVDLFVDKALRRNGECRRLLFKLAEVTGHKNMFGNVWLNDPNKNETLLAVLHLGFVVELANANFITLAKYFTEEK